MVKKRYCVWGGGSFIYTPGHSLDTPNFTPGTQPKYNHKSYWVGEHLQECKRPQHQADAWVVGVGAVNRKRKGQQYATLKIIIFIFLIPAMDGK